jgi:hypothetical protein
MPKNAGAASAFDGGDTDLGTLRSSEQPTTPEKHNCKAVF